MINRIVVIFLCVCAVTLVLSCGDGVDESNGQMDTSVIGLWEGAIGELIVFNFYGVQFFTRITAQDSAFQLVARELDTAAADQDTTLDMAGRWRMNVTRDSILLLPDTCRIIDTAQNALVPRPVRGSVIPLPVAISKNGTTGEIEWVVAFSDLIPIAPLLGINVTGIDPRLLSGSIITMVKQSQ
jgi:hypothetical protein